MTRIYIVRIPMPGTDLLFDLCRCTKPEHAAEIVRALLQAAEGEPVRIIVESMIGG